jgi:phosphatidylserine synthase
MEQSATPSNEDPVVQSSRREAIVVAVIWLTAMIYCVGYCYRFGYNRSAQTLTFVWGVPDWAFWGVVVPWAAFTLVAFWLASVFMRDEDFERDCEPAGDACDSPEAEHAG